MENMQERFQKLNEDIYRGDEELQDSQTVVHQLPFVVLSRQTSKLVAAKCSVMMYVFCAGDKPKCKLFGVKTCTLTLTIKTVSHFSKHSEVTMLQQKSLLDGVKVCTIILILNLFLTSLHDSQLFALPIVSVAFQNSYNVK